MAIPAVITVTRVGTQVVVRFAGDVGDQHAEALKEALDDVDRLALRRVAVDLSCARRIDGIAIDFLVALNGRWVVKHLNTPPHLRGLLPPTFATSPLVAEA